MKSDFPTTVLKVIGVLLDDIFYWLLNSYGLINIYIRALMNNLIHNTNKCTSIKTQSRKIHQDSEVFLQILLTQAYVNTNDWIKIIFLHILDFIQFAVNAVCEELLHMLRISQHFIRSSFHIRMARVCYRRTFLMYLFLRFAAVSYGRFIAVRFGFNLSMYVQNRWW